MQTCCRVTSQNCKRCTTESKPYLKSGPGCRHTKTTISGSEHALRHSSAESTTSVMHESEPASRICRYQSTAAIRWRVGPRDPPPSLSSLLERSPQPDLGASCIAWYWRDAVRAYPFAALLKRLADIIPHQCHRLIGDNSVEPLFSFNS